MDLESAFGQILAIVSSLLGLPGYVLLLVVTLFSGCDTFECLGLPAP